MHDRKTGVWQSGIGKEQSSVIGDVRASSTDYK
jgi:hypothetical protein